MRSCLELATLIWMINHPPVPGIGATLKLNCDISTAGCRHIAGYGSLRSPASQPAHSTQDDDRKINLILLCLFNAPRFLQHIYRHLEVTFGSLNYLLALLCTVAR